MSFEPERVSISLAQLRSELAALELRLVDRLNDAVAHKADASVVYAIDARSTANAVRLTAIESILIAPERLAHIEQEISNLQSLAGYRKWLYAQTAALVGVAAAVVSLVIH